MLKSHKTMLALSEKRQKQTELAEAVNASASGATEDQVKERTALATDITKLETEYRRQIETKAANETRGLGDAEARERRALVADSNIGAIFAAVVEHRQTDGEVAELQQALKLAANQVPLELLETRAVTPAPGEVQREIKRQSSRTCFRTRVAEFLSDPAPNGRGGRGDLSDADRRDRCSRAGRERGGGRNDRRVHGRKAGAGPAPERASFYSREDAALYSPAWAMRCAQT